MKIVNKTWGREIWMVNNELYCGKILELYKNKRCSYHYHRKKDETFYLLNGKILLEINGDTSILIPGDSVRINPGTRHRYTGLEDSEIIEISTHHSDSDTYRLEV